MKKFNPFLLIIIFIILSLIIIQTNQQFINNNITKQKIKACISIHRLKFIQEKELIDYFFKKMEKILKREEQKILYLALAICVNEINNDDALKINNLIDNSKMVKLYNKEIKKLYDLDKYDYSNQTNNAYLFNNFIPVFDKIYEEIEKENKRFFEEKYIYFIHTPLFKLFLIYTIINTIIIFTKRLKKKKKIIDNEGDYKNCLSDYHCLERYKKEDEEDNSSDKEINDKNENNEDKKKESKPEFRKLNKKCKIGRKKI